MAVAGIGPKGQAVMTRPRGFSPLMHAMADAAGLDLRLRTYYPDDEYAQRTARRLREFIAELCDRQAPPGWFRE